MSECKHTMDNIGVDWGTGETTALVWKPCNHGVVIEEQPTCPYCRIEELKADVAHEKQYMTEWRDRYYKLERLAAERDGGTHDYDCKIHRRDNPVCNCGHDALAAVLEVK